MINDTFFTFTFLPDSECLYEKYVSIVSLYMGHKANIRNNYQPHALSLQKSVRKIATQNATVVISVQMITRWESEKTKFGRLIESNEHCAVSLVIISTLLSHTYQIVNYWIWDWDLTCEPWSNESTENCTLLFISPLSNFDKDFFNVCCSFPPFFLHLSIFVT